MKSSPFEEGDPNAPLLFLAEAPASVEMRMGHPLAGPSGDVFNDCLHTAGLIRNQSYILNLWPFRVGKDEKKKTMFVADRPSEILFTSKGFTQSGLEAAQPALDKAKRSKAHQVISLGRPALAGLMGDNRPIMKWRGSPLWSERVNKKVIPTIHPAATLHGTFLWRYLIINDFKKAARHLEHGPKLILPKRSILVDPTFEDIMDYMDMVEHDKKRFATDLEVINHQTSCFCICPDAHNGMVIPLSDEFGNPWWEEQEEMQIWLRYARLMGNEHIQKINQNLIGFDIPFLLQQNNLFTYGPCDDNMIAQKILYPEFNKGLDFQVSLYTDEPYYKDEGKMWKGMGGDIVQFWNYNGKDGCTSIECWDDLHAQMIEKGYLDTYERVRDRGRFLWYMTVRGFRVNHDKLAATHKKVSANLDAKENELATVAKYPFNVSSPKQCQLYFYGALGFKPYTNREGNPTTDDKAMARIFRKHGTPEAKLVQEIRALRKLKSTYLEVTFDADGRLRCSWDPTGTKFGRLSSSESIFGTGMNLQNLHPEFKEFLEADDEEWKEPAL